MAQAWAVSIMSWLNRTLPRDDFHALVNIRPGNQIEMDVSEYRKDEIPDSDSEANGSLAILTAAPPALFTIPAIFPDEIEIEVRERRNGRPLVGAIELISPANKKDKDERASFVSKCVAYLRKGIGLVIIDVVTERRANLHNELMVALTAPSTTALSNSPTYLAGYRPVHRRSHHSNEIEMWPSSLNVGDTIPKVPFGLRGGPILMLDLEATYNEALHAGGL